MASKKDTLLSELGELDHLKKIKTAMQTRGVTLSRMGSFLEDHLALEALGCTEDTAKILAAELNKTKLSPERAAIKVASLLKKSQSLEDAVNNLEEREATLNHVVGQHEQKLTLLTREVEGKQQQISALEAEKQDKIRQEKDLIDTAIEEYEKQQITKLKPLKTTLDNLGAEVQEKEREKIELERITGEHKDRIIMSEGFIQILRDPASTPLIQLKTLSKYVNSALEDREKFPNLAEGRIKDAKSTAIEILNVYMGRDIVSGADYRKALR